MELTKQNQSAGDNSTQMQAGVINNYTIVNGIDEARARSIWKEEYAIAKQELTEEAQMVAVNRVHQLEEKVMPKLLAYDKSMSFFADPSFQILLRKAQITAAASERKADYDMLAELLLHRIEQGEDRERRLGISKAIEIVDQISDDAICGLSTFYAVSSFCPNSDDFYEGLSVFNELYEKVIDNKKLPNGENWLEHLDLLSVIRLSTKGIGSFKKMKEFAPAIFSKHLISGIKEDSEEYATIKKQFEQCGISLDCFVPHPLKPGYVKLKISNNIGDIYIYDHVIDTDTTHMPLNEAQIEVINKVINITRKDESNNEQLVSKLMEEWDKYPTLYVVRQWWDKLPRFFSVTAIGRAIANAYIQGKEPRVPCLY